MDKLRPNRDGTGRHGDLSSSRSFFDTIIVSYKSKVKMQNFNSKFKSDLLQRCYDFGIEIIALADKLPNKKSAWIIADQSIRSATSIGANITEGKASSSRLEFKKFYEIALKSANESVYWLNLLKDTKLADNELINNLLKENKEICSMLAAGVIKLKKN